MEVDEVSVVRSRGAVTLDEFTLGHKLGSGGMAKVYLAKTADGREFALKVFKWDNKDFDRESFVQVQNEYHQSAQLSNEHVVKFYGFRAESMLNKLNKCYKVSYIIQELISGGELFDYIDDHGYFERHVVRYLISQILKGVLFLHSNGLAHRDLKTSNILFDANFNIKIVDLGLAKRIQGDAGDGLLNS